MVAALDQASAKIMRRGLASNRTINEARFFRAEHDAQQKNLRNVRLALLGLAVLSLTEVVIALAIVLAKQ